MRDRELLNSQHVPRLGLVQQVDREEQKTIDISILLVGMPRKTCALP